MTDKIKEISQTSEKEKLIHKEVLRLKKTFKNIDENKKKLVQATIEDAAFMSVTMAELRATINRNGTTIEYKNGENQYGTKQSPDVQTYLQLSQKLSAAMKILLECQPKTPPAPVPVKDDGFEDFVEGREDV